MTVFARRNFSLKLIFSYVLVVSVAFGGMAFFLDKRLEQNTVEDIKVALVHQAFLIQSQVTPGQLKPQDAEALQALVKRLALPINSRVTIIDKQGRVLADSARSAQEVLTMENHLTRPEVRAALAGNVGVEAHYSLSLKVKMFYVALGIKDGKEPVGVVRLAVPLTRVEKTLWDVRKTIFDGLLLAWLLAFILGFLFAARIVRPIQRMIQVSRSYARGDFSRRIIVSSRSEIGELAATLNKMAADLENNIREIKSQNQMFEAIFSSMIEGVIVVDKNGRIVALNPTIERIFAIDKKDVAGKSFLEAIRNHEIAEVIGKVLKEGRALSGEMDVVLPVRRIFQFNAVPVFDQATVSGCLVVIHDISEMRRLEIMRKDFVANVSHELKTPLTSIRGFTETLLGGALEDKQHNRGFLKIIQDHAQRLNNLVDDLLSLSNLESKEEVLKKTPFNVNQLVKAVASEFDARFKKKGIKFTNELPAELLLTADRQKIEQVFINLVDNAIKFNKENGCIRIYSQESPGRMKVVVEDSGIGIPEKDILRVFERFYRVDKARSREAGGTGLGLSIVKHIMELHNGSVGAESTEGLGSKFWIILPA